MMKIQIKCDDRNKWSNEINDARRMIGNDDLSRTHDNGWWHMTFNEHYKFYKMVWNWLIMVSKEE